MEHPIGNDEGRNMIVLMDLSKTLRTDTESNVDLEAFAEKLWNKFCDMRYANHKPVKEIFLGALIEVLK